MLTVCSLEAHLQGKFDISIESASIWNQISEVVVRMYALNIFDNNM